MLGRWRTQQSAKHLEEERLNAERERSSSDAASPRSPDTAPPSSATSPRSQEGSLHSVHTPEPPSTPISPASDQPTPVSLDASLHAQPGTSPPAGPATVDVSPYVTVTMPPAQAQPDPDSNPGPVADPDTVPDSDPVRDAAGGADTPLADKDGVAPDSTASGDGVQGTPTSTKEAVEDLEGKPYEDVSVAEKEVTSSEDDQSKTAKDVPISNDAEIRQNDVKIPSVEDPLKKAASEIRSGDLERSNTVVHSAGAEFEQKSEGASKVDEKSADVIETTKGRGEISPRSKNSSDGQQSVESGSNESDSNSSHNNRQTSEPCKPDVLHFEFDRKIKIQHNAPSPPRPLNVSPHDQILETYRRSGSFETVNYLSHTSLGQCAQRAFGAAKANPITGCAVSLVEMGVRLVTAPIVPLIRCWQTPLLCVDRIFYEGFSGVTRAFACVPRTDGVCCGLRDCECSIPIIYTGECTKIDGKPKED